MKIAIKYFNPSLGSDKVIEFNNIAEPPKIAFYGEPQLTSISITHLDIKVSCDFTNTDPFYSFFRDYVNYIRDITVISGGKEILKGWLDGWKEDRTNFNVELNITSDADNFDEDIEDVSLTIKSTKSQPSESLLKLKNDVRKKIVAFSKGQFSHYNINYPQIGDSFLWNDMFVAISNALINEHGYGVRIDVHGQDAPAIRQGDFTYQFDCDIEIIGDKQIDVLKAAIQMLGNKTVIIGNNIWSDPTTQRPPGHYIDFGNGDGYAEIDGWIKSVEPMFIEEETYYVVKKAVLKLFYPAATYTYDLKQNMNDSLKRRTERNIRSFELEGELSEFVYPTQIIVHKSTGYRVLEIEYDTMLLEKGVYFAKVKAFL